MKKSMIIIVAVIYILGIVVVGIMGAKVDFTNRRVYVDSVKFVNPESEEGIFKILPGSADKKYIQPKYEPSEDLEIYGLFFYDLAWEILPANATNKEVVFSVDEAYEGKVKVETNGRIIFYEYVSGITVYMRTADGAKKDNLMILLMK